MLQQREMHSQQIVPATVQMHGLHITIMITAFSLKKIPLSDVISWISLVLE